MIDATKSERVKLGLARASAYGRKPGPPLKATDAQIRAVPAYGTVDGARRVGLSKSQFIARRRQIEEGDRASNSGLEGKADDHGQ